MVGPGDQMSVVPDEGIYLYPDGKVHTLNDDWEAGPRAIGNTAFGMHDQAWHLELIGSDFVLTPEDTGAPVVALPSVNSVQCAFAFDQNANYTIAWEDNTNQGHLYWFDSAQGMYVTTDFANPIIGLALLLDDKRLLETRVNDVRLWYTLPEGDHHVLYQRKQIDRYETPYEMANPVWPYIHKSGMSDKLRVQFSMSTEGLPP